MESILSNPLVWGGGGILVIALIILISVAISKRRAREVEELEKMFPVRNPDQDGTEKIPVEKVRRTTLEREKRKKSGQYPTEPKMPPKKGEKAFPGEDKEIIITGGDASEPEPSQKQPVDQEEKRRSPSFFKTRSKRKTSSRNSDELEDLTGMMEEVEDQEESFAIKRTTKKATVENNSKESTEEKADEKKVDAATSRRLYKRSLLNPGSVLDEDSEETVPESEDLSASTRMGGDALTHRTVKKDKNDEEYSDENQGKISEEAPSGYFGKRQGFPTRSVQKKQPGPLPEAQDGHEEVNELPSRSKRRPKKKFFKR
ncbi:hypothetical protein ACFO25_01070 [Paenactinomyces guangxiensis]|uniref:Uncharacterized protein n=1 Tax=Paenactinomyces guangxiensis TaxID=1490290 RepID=A0A7W1WSQ9_9BACL|nr:hypothetical protein [Paenactinomyces guangxiensis]MBA4495354.1 hypothetical protein [Paenactinomyces guangxiensis]MBH8592525.1 hypothetical protein [Paenactinomyces guangxiensis]